VSKITAAAATEDSRGNWWDAELLRVLGGMRLRRDKDVAAAQDTFSIATQLTEQQGALLLGLRAASDLVRTTLGPAGNGQARRALDGVLLRVPDQPKSDDREKALHALTGQDSQPNDPLGHAISRQYCRV
jgi:hypothetical protein